MRNGNSRAAGIALVLVLWMLALLSVLALTVTTNQRTTTALIANQLEQAQFYAVTDAALTLIMLELLSDSTLAGETELGPLLPDGRPRQRTLMGMRLEVRLENETSRLSLNAATPEELAWLIEQAQGPEAYDAEVATSLADAIFDWRDADELALLNGAEDPEYAALDFPYGARDAPFLSVSELKLVRGMTDALYRQLEPALTLIETRSGVDQTFASPLVLSVLRRIDLETAKTLRDTAEGTGDSALAVASWDRGGPWYRIKLRLLAEQGGGPRMEALVRVNQGSRQPFEVLWRRYGD